MNDGQSLHILAQLRFLQGLAIDEIRLILSTLRGTDIVESREYPLRASLAARSLRAQSADAEVVGTAPVGAVGQNLNVSMSIPVSETDITLSYSGGRAPACSVRSPQVRRRLS